MAIMKKPSTAIVQGSIPALLWKRIAAFIVDILVLELTVLTPFRNVIERAIPINHLSFSALNNIQVSGSLAVALLLMGLLSVLYFALCESILGQTVGKMLFHLRVAGIGNPPGFWQCFIRSMFLLPVFPFIMFWMVDPLYMFFTSSSQRLLERWSRTATVESAPFSFQISTVA